MVPRWKARARVNAQMYSARLRARCQEPEMAGVNWV